MHPLRPEGKTVIHTSTLERYSEQRDDADWVSRQLRSHRARVIVVSEGDLLVNHGGLDCRLLTFVPDDIPEFLGEYAFLGVQDNTRYFCVSVDQASRPSFLNQPGHRFSSRSALMRMDESQFELSIYARAVELWWRNHRFCSRCGTANRLDAAGFRMQCVAPQCGYESFPRLEPAIIVLTEHEGRCLLGRQPGWPEGVYSTLAGFVEPGESIEQAVAREVNEESGVTIAEVSYQHSQAWPFPASLMLGFYARADNPEIRCGTELEDARWFSVDELEASVRQGTIKLSTRFSISYHLLANWCRLRHDRHINDWITT